MNDDIKQKLKGMYLTAEVQYSDERSNKKYTGLVTKVTNDFLELHGDTDQIILFAGVDQGIESIYNPLKVEHVDMVKITPFTYRNKAVDKAYINGAKLTLEERTHVQAQGTFMFNK